MKIGIVGKNGSGKSTVCEYLKQEGYQVVSLSDSLRREATSLGMSLTRDNLTNLGRQLKKDEGQDVLAKRLYQYVQSQGWENTVFDSIRNVAEVDYLISKGLSIFGVDAPIRVRYDRIKLRKKETDFVDFETFKRQDETESQGDNPAQQLNKVLLKCQYVFDNQGDETVLYREIDRVMLNRNK